MNIITQDVFMVNMGHGCIIIAKVNQEQHSSNQTLANQYKNGNFLNTLGQVIACLQNQDLLPSHDAIIDHIGNHGNVIGHTFNFNDKHMAIYGDDEISDYDDVTSSSSYNPVSGLGGVY